MSLNIEKSRAQLRLPLLVVFDLDSCLWTPEMFELRGSPTEPVKGELLQAGEGIVGVKCESGQTVKLFPGALAALQEMLTDPAWKNSKIAAASSSLVPKYSYQCLELLEVFPGKTLKEVFEFHAIGRQGELSSDKRTHFNKLHLESKIPFDEMVFFDDCMWGDNVGHITKHFGVVGVRTPRGLTTSEWEKALNLFHESKQ
mmetsp:Transcript_702/g.853  ORF Transcript_702/g.853 Transcript_702/m.853 type:complete len:200 (-) Transcript_702:423-1022(-)